MNLKNNDISRIQYNNKYNQALIFFTIFLLIFIPLYIKFYTGNSLSNAFSTFASSTGGDSNYAIYQKYFTENSLNEFSLTKLPYIFLNGIAKVVFWFLCIYFVAFRHKLSLTNIVCLCAIFVLYFASGVARGTSFENFELLVVLVFSIYAGRMIKYGKNFISKRQIVFLLTLVLIGGTYFIFSKSLRASGQVLTNFYGPTSTLSFSKDSPIMEIAPWVGIIALEFSGYFLFPLYFTSEVFWKIFFGSVEGACAALCPVSGPLLFENALGYRNTLETLGVDCGACWNPDITSIIYYLGIPLYLVVVYILGKLAGRCYYKGIYGHNVASVLLLFVITYEMISLPVGNFIVISSANKISLFIIIILAMTKLNKKFIVK